VVAEAHTATDTTESDIAALYQQAEQLVASLTSPRKDRLRLIALGLAEHICNLWSQHPEPMLAELMLYSRKRSLASQWLVKCAILSTALAHQLNWSQRAAFGLAVSALLMDLSILDELSQLLNNQKLSDEQQQRWKQHPVLSAQLAKQQGFSEKLLLLSILQHQERADGSGFPKRLLRHQTTEPAQLLSLVSRFLFALYPRRGLAARHYQQLLKQFYSELPSLTGSHYRALIQLLSPVAPGSLLQDHHKRLLLVMKRPAYNYCWVVTLPNNSTIEHATLLRLGPDDIAREHPAMVIPSIDLAKHWYQGHRELMDQSGAAWSTQQLSASQELVALSHELQDEAFRLADVVDKIEQKPALTGQILQLANRQTKQAKPIGSVKHAISLLGLERLLPVLLRGGLQHELQRRQFASFAWLDHCAQLYAECAAELANYSLFLTPDWARTLASFVSAGLLSYPALHTHCVTTHQLRSERSGRFAQLFISDASKLREHSIGLMNSWELPLHLQHTLQYHYADPELDEPGKRVIHQDHLLRLASFILYELYTGQPLADTTAAMKQSLMKRISLSEAQYTAAKTAVIEGGLLVCPLV